MVKDTISFIEAAKAIHGDKYDYSKVEYVNAKTKVCIICPIHGEFWQTPNNHTNKTKAKGCPKCGGHVVTDTESFITEAKKVHGDKYDYSKVEYISNDTKVCIICPKHGEFWQRPHSHLSGANCPKCSHQSYLHTTESFIEEARKVHGDKYDYSKVEYVNSHTKVCIICPKHGEFWQLATNHLRKRGCPKCKAEETYKRQVSSKEEFIEKARKVHGDKYDYSKVEYINNKTKVCIICPKHGEFWQTPNHHLKGKGCSKCNDSKLEKSVENELIKKNISFEKGKHFKWLGKQHLDFYLLEYNIAIECQGGQHFSKYRFEKTVEKLNLRIERDSLKNKLCKKENVKLIYFTTEKILKYEMKIKPSFYENIYTDLEEIIKQIRHTNYSVCLIFVYHSKSSSHQSVSPIKSIPIGGASFNFLRIALHL